MDKQYFKFLEGPFQGLIFHIVHNDVDNHMKDLEFGQYRHKLNLSDETYEEWKPVLC